MTATVACETLQVERVGRVMSALSPVRIWFKA